MQMRPSRVLKKLRAGETASCVKLNLSDPLVAEIAAMSGFDCLWCDLEHVPNDLSQVGNQIRAAKVYDVDMLVRVPRGSYSDLVRPLEMDAAGIMVPHVMSAADAKQVVWQTRFHPIGRRPIDGGNSDGAFCRISLPDYIRQANAQRFVIVQIEDPEPMDELDAIAALPGIDMLFFGPGDFSHALGIAGQGQAAPVVEARLKIAEAALRHGKFAGTVGSVDSIPDLVGMGYRFISVGADVIALTETFARFAGAFDAAAAPHAAADRNAHSAAGGARSPYA